MRKFIQYISFLPILVFATLSGCSSPENTVLNFKNLPAVTSMAGEMSKDDALAIVQTTPAAAAPNYKVNPDGIHAQQQVTKPAGYAPDMYSIQQGQFGERTYGAGNTAWNSPIGDAQKVIPEKEMIFPVFLPFAQIDGAQVKPINGKQQVTIFAGPSSNTQIIIDNAKLNSFLAALYTLCPKLH